MEFDKIVIHFENSETATFPQEDIISIDIRGITRNYLYHNKEYQLPIGNNDYELAEYVHVLLSPNANVPENLQPTYDTHLPFERMQKYKDIVAIDFHLRSSKVRTIEVKWEGYHSDNNKLQNSTIVGDDLMIMIGRE